MAEIEYPHRRHRLTLDIEGDTLADVAAKLEDIAWSARAGEAPSDSTFGGVTVGGSLVWTTDEMQNHESYFEQLDAWRAAKDAPHTDLEADRG